MRRKFCRNHKIVNGFVGCAMSILPADVSASHPESSKRIRGVLTAHIASRANAGDFRAPRLGHIARANANLSAASDVGRYQICRRFHLINIRINRHNSSRKADPNAG